MRDIDDFKFTGPFSKEIPLYVQYKRSCGYKVAESDLYRLREMDRFFKGMGISDPVITREMYEAWTAVKPGERKVTSSRRRGILSSFGKYLISNGYQDVYAGHDDRRSFNSDYIPYVFSKEEISRMFALLDESCSKSPCYENDAFRTMMSMYYCCGFRKSEVVMLRLCDVDFQTGKVTVLDGKNRVSRIVLTSDTLLSRMGAFYSKYHSQSSPDTFLFHGTKHKDKPFCKDSLYKMYHGLLKNAGVPDREDGRVHRLHDVRHTFCVYALEQMQEKGFDTYTSLPLLSAYLGHKHIRETEYYLRLVEDRQDTVLEKAEEYTPGLFPEIGEKNMDSTFTYHLTKYFSDYLPNQLAASIHTIRSYRDTFVQLMEFYKGTYHIPPEKLEYSSFSAQRIEEFLKWLEVTHKISIRTRNQRLAAIHAFFRYLQYRDPAGFSQCVQVLSVPFKKAPAVPVNYMTLEETAFLFSLPDQKDDMQLRDLAVLVLLYESGARVQELTDLCPCHIRFGATNTITLHGKGNKTRLVPICNNVAKILKVYMKRCGRNAPDCPLFVNRKGEKLTRAGTQYIIDKYINMGKKQKPDYFKNRITNHSFRHSKAMHLLEAGVNLVYIRDLLGHTSILTTEIYARTNPKIKEEQLKKNSTSINATAKYGKKEKEDLIDWLKKTL